jgi:tripartite-type tricarboxylate transporter receptor subunit TctC
MLTGAEMQHVPFREVSQLFMSVGSGDVGWSFASIPSSQGAYKAGKIRYVAVAAPKRIPQLPDVPTMAEAGYPQYAVSVWYGVAAQSKLPDEVAQKLKASLDRALSDDTFRASLDNSGFAPLRPKSFADIEKFIDADRKLWAGVIKELNISLD